MSGPLTGFKVIDATAMISGPIATRILADQGADVIKIEPPGIGDLVRAFGSHRNGFPAIFLTSNRNKRSVVLDLKQTRGLEVLKRLVADADVFVQNFRPGKAEQMGIGEADLRAVKPDLIYVSISGFGESGPYSDKRVYDPVIQALSGLAAVQADWKTGRPQMMRLIIPDKLTALTAAQSITAALLSRERTGKGQHVKLAMLDAMVAFLWPEAMARHTFVDHDDTRDRRLAKDLVFETADGYMTVGAVSDEEWRGLCLALERPDWLEDERFQTAVGRIQHIDDRLNMTEEVTRERTTDEWLERFDARQVPCAPIRNLDELWHDPQIVENELIVEMDHPVVGRIRQPRPAERFDATPSEIRLPAPALGEHTEEVLAEIGLDRTEINELKDAKVLG
ncbi:MAG: CoA transferase [bacterium]|nr:CoA transferase [bacterium]